MKPLRKRVKVVLAILLLATVGAGSAAQTARPAEYRASRQNGADVFYQIFVRSFRDSNDDRLGDLRGIQLSLDYLQRLGVTAVLLTPIQPSPFYHNYFASSFEGVDQAYGSMSDFVSLVRAIHARHMKLVLDIEIQYATRDHPWIKESEGRPGSPFSKFIYHNGPGNTEPESGFLGLSTFPAYDGRNIEVVSVNLNDADVQAFFRKWFLAWIDPNGDGSCRDGVDGFRIDHMMDDLDNKDKLKNLFSSFWVPIFAAVRSVNPRAKIIAEQADWGYGEDWLTRGGVDMVFAFPLRKAIVSFDKAAIYRAMRETDARTPAGKAQVTFIENHDVNRFASEVNGSLAKEKVGAAFDLLLPGIPLLYYGQELGMRGKQFKAWNSDANDIPVREAFRWARDLEAPGSAIWYKGPHPWWEERYNRSGDGISVEEEAEAPDSLLSYYRTLLAIRARRAELQYGGGRLLCESTQSLVCFVRALGRSRSLVVINLADTPGHSEFTSADLDSRGLKGRWIDLLEHNRPANPLDVVVAGFGVRLLATQ